MNCLQRLDNLTQLIDDCLETCSTVENSKYKIFEIDYTDVVICNAVRKLWQEYSNLDIIKTSVCMVGFEQELKQFVRTSGPVSNGATIVASLNTKDNSNKLDIIAAISIKPWKHEPLADSKAEQSIKYAELKRLYVLPKYQKQGIATRLIQFCLEKARLLGYTHVRLDTLSTMKKAQNLYLKHGFKQIDPMPLDTVNLQMRNPKDKVIFFARKI